MAMSKRMKVDINEKNFNDYEWLTVNILKQLISDKFTFFKFGLLMASGHNCLKTFYNDSNDDHSVAVEKLAKYVHKKWAPASFRKKFQNAIFRCAKWAQFQEQCEEKPPFDEMCAKFCPKERLCFIYEMEKFKASYFAFELILFILAELTAYDQECYESLMHFFASNQDKERISHTTMKTDDQRLILYCAMVELLERSGMERTAKFVEEGFSRTNQYLLYYSVLSNIKHYTGWEGVNMEKAVKIIAPSGEAISRYHGRYPVPVGGTSDHMEGLEGREEGDDDETEDEMQFEMDTTDIKESPDGRKSQPKYPPNSEAEVDILDMDSGIVVPSVDKEVIVHTSNSMTTFRETSEAVPIPRNTDDRFKMDAMENEMTVTKDEFLPMPSDEEMSTLPPSQPLC